MSKFRLLIDGKLVPGAAELTVINPATEDVLALAPRADRAQLDLAVASAKAAFPAWEDTIRQRGALLVKLADAMRARKEGMA
jgi:acyl-CoA reductase-like NAD-dependent aldehyde dehydrogenase